MSRNTEQSRVRFDQHAIFIDEKPVIVLCGSLFYFRIPRGLWQDRLQKIKAAGYNCIDVYIPWNYHELVEGGWDFSGERDVEAFFQLAVDTGLWIVARPGPYICSEWDGGGLPAYLYAYHDLRIRQNDPLYLKYVKQWFDKILPILHPFQMDRQGNGTHGGIIAIQLENELDFFDCDDPAGYMCALQEMALDNAITVPLIACAGQGDLSGATGDVADIVPTGNFYPAPLDPGIEAKVSFYRQALEHRNIPLMVTETHRSHFHLRRLLSCGVKLLGPYNQVAGTDFGFTNAVNNWGEPLAFLTTDYNFHSMITSAGALTDEFFEARLLARLFDILGEPLVQAVPTDCHSLVLHTELPVTEDGPYALKLRDGGTLIAFPNLTRTAGSLKIQDAEVTFPQHSTFTISPGRCPLLLWELPLQQWGIDGTLRYATAELGYAALCSGQVVLVFYADQVGELALTFSTAVTVDTEGMTIHAANQHVTCSFDAEQISILHIHFPDGKRLQIVGMNRQRAARLENVDADGTLIWNEDYAHQPEGMPHDFVPLSQIAWSSYRLPHHTGEQLYQSKIACGAHPKHLEEVGILRGYGWYGAKINGLTPPHQQVKGFLLHNGADICSLYVNGQHHGTVTPGGGCAYLPALESSNTHGSETDILVRTEIWGHSNFDDARLPAIRLGSLRGIQDLTAVTRLRDLSKNWHFAPIFTDEQKTELLAPGQDTSKWIMVDWANWLTAQHPQRGCFRKRFSASDDMNSWILHFPGLHFLAEVVVNGCSFRHVNPYTPYVDISAAIQPGQPVDVAIYTEKFYLAGGGTVTLLEGVLAKEWWIAGSAESELADSAREMRPRATSAELPFRLSAGELSWLWGDLPELDGCHIARFSGRNVKLSVLLNGKLIGRLWLPSGDIRPRMAGGADNIIYFPGPWFQKEHNTLALLIESVKIGEEGEITEIEWLRQ